MLSDLKGDDFLFLSSFRAMLWNHVADQASCCKGRGQGGEYVKRQKERGCYQHARNASQETSQESRQLPYPVRQPQIGWQNQKDKYHGQDDERPSCIKCQLSAEKRMTFHKGRNHRWRGDKSKAHRPPQNPCLQRSLHSTPHRFGRAVQFRLCFRKKTTTKLKKRTIAAPPNQAAYLGLEGMAATGGSARSLLLCSEDSPDLLSW